MAHWICSTCGYYLQGAAPPERCPSCQRVCAFNDVTCYRPECGGEQNIDPILVGTTLRIFKSDMAFPAGPRATLPSPKTISLAEILMGHEINRKEDLEQLSFWAISQVDILKGLSRQQRQQLRSLGRIEHYEPKVDICTEGTEARKFCVIEEGQVSVESQVAKGLRFPISIVYPGHAFGWSAIVPPYVYTATVVALSKTRVISIEREALLAMLQADPSLGFTVMQNVASIVASRLRTVELAIAGLFQQAR